MNARQPLGVALGLKRDETVAIVGGGGKTAAMFRLAREEDVQRVLLGAKPGDLPVERIDRLHLALNLKTAKAIGVTIPKSVLDRADEIVQ